MDSSTNPTQAAINGLTSTLKHYQALGVKLHLLTRGGKGFDSADDGYQRTQDPDVIRSHIAAGKNLGFSPGHSLLVVDIDIKDPNKPGKQSFKRLDLPRTLTVQTASGGWHAYFRLPAEVGKLRTYLDAYPGIDFLTGNQNVVCAGSVVVNGSTGQYRIVDERKIADAPEDLLDRLQDRALREGWTPPEEKMSLEEMRRLLERINPDHGYEQWVQTGMALHYETDGGLEGLDLFDEWSQRGAKYRAGEPHKKWGSFHQDEIGDQMITGRSLYAFASRVTFEPLVEEETEERKGFYFAHPSDFHMDSKQWCIEGLFYAGGATLMYGPSGTMKSFAAIDIAMRIATGQQFAGKSVERGCVAYLASESRGETGDRTAAWEHVNFGGAKAPFFMSSMGLQLAAEPNAAQLMIEALREIQALSSLVLRLVVVDTFARSFGGEENSATDVARFNITLDKVRAEFPDMSFLVVAHSGKDAGRGPRGSSALMANFDGAIEVSAQGQLANKLTVTKSKARGEGNCFQYHYTEIGDTLVGSPAEYFEPVEPTTVEAETEIIVPRKEQLRLEDGEYWAEFEDGISRRAFTQRVAAALHERGALGEPGSVSESDKKMIRNAIAEFIQQQGLEVEGATKHQTLRKAATES